MNNTKICVFIAASMLFITTNAQKSKKCFALLDQKKYESALNCFITSPDSSSFENLYGIAESYVSLRINPSNLDSAFFYVQKAEIKYDSLDAREKQKLKDKLGIYSASFDKIKNRSAFFAYKYINDTVIDELESFIARFPGTASIPEVNQRIDELHLFANLPTDKPLDFYWSVIAKYPDNARINDIWQIFYQNYTFDGELLTLEKFTINYPQYPFPNQIERDRNTAQMAERHKLDLKYTASLAHIYDAYITLAAPRIRALKALRMYISPYVQAKQFTRAADTVRLFAEQFGDTKEYSQLLHVLTAKESVPTKTTIPGLVNSPGYEFSPVLTQNDHVLYFCGKERAGCIGGEDIFVSEFVDSSWTNPIVIPGVNTVLGNEAPESLSADGTRMLLFQNGDIYYSDKYLNKKGELRWADPVRIQTINTAGWEGDASLSSDGKAILFASESGVRENKQFIARDRKDLFDIFVSVKNGDNWELPISLGSVINTPGCDRYPFLHPDMKTLYFSSENHGSIGGLDVFMSQRLNDSSWTEWSEPVSLGRYINTISNDTGYKISNDGNRAFYAGFGGARYDIYTVDLPENRRPQKVGVISGRILNADSIGIQADVLVEDLETKQIVGEFRSDVQDGTFTMILPLGRNYGYFVSKHGFFPSSDNVDLRTETSMVEVSREFVLHSIDTIVKYNQPIEIKNVFFDTDDFTLDETSYAELTRLVKVVRDNHIKGVVIEGHTDSVGTAESNIILSQKRANAVLDFLVVQGISARELEAQGIGSLSPTADNATDVGRAKNRRVEVRLRK